MSVQTKTLVFLLLVLLGSILTVTPLRGQGVLKEQIEGSYAGQWTIEGLNSGPEGFPKYRKTVELVLPQYAEVAALPGDTLSITLDSLTLCYSLKSFNTRYEAQTRTTNLFYEFADDSLRKQELELITKDERLKLTFMLQRPLPSWHYSGSTGAGEATAFGEVHEERFSLKFAATYRGTFDTQPMEGRCALLLTLIRTQSPQSKRDQRGDSLRSAPRSSSSAQWGSLRRM